MIGKEAVEEEIKRLDSRIIALEQDIKISRAEKRASINVTDLPRDEN